MQNFDKYMGIYATSGALQTALSTGALKTPYVALVGANEEIKYNELFWIAMFVDGDFESGMPKNMANNTWTPLWTTVNSGSIISFKTAELVNPGLVYGDTISFYVDNTSYTAYTAEANLSNIVLTLTNGNYYLTFSASTPTPDGVYVQEDGWDDPMEIPYNSAVTPASAISLENTYFTAYDMEMNELTVVWYRTVTSYYEGTTSEPEMISENATISGYDIRDGADSDWEGRLVITAMTAEPDEDYLIYPENPPHVILHLAPDPVQVAAAEECWNNGSTYDFLSDTCEGEECFDDSTQSCCEAFGGTWIDDGLGGGGGFCDYS